MTCEEYQSKVMTGNSPCDVTRVERAHMQKHYNGCEGCRDWLNSATPPEITSHPLEDRAIDAIADADGVHPEYRKIVYGDLEAN